MGFKIRDDVLDNPVLEVRYDDLQETWLVLITQTTYIVYPIYVTTSSSGVLDIEQLSLVAREMLSGISKRDVYIVDDVSVKVFACYLWVCVVLLNKNIVLATVLLPYELEISLVYVPIGNDAYSTNVMQIFVLTTLGMAIVCVVAVAFYAIEDPEPIVRIAERVFLRVPVLNIRVVFASLSVAMPILLVMAFNAD